MSITRWLPGVALRPNGVSGAASVAVGVADSEPALQALAPTRLTARTRKRVGLVVGQAASPWWLVAVPPVEVQVPEKSSSYS